MKYNTVEIHSFKDYTANTHFSDIVLLNAHQNP